MLKNLFLFIYWEDYIFISGKDENFEIFIGEDYIEIWHLKPNGNSEIISKEKFINKLQNLQKMEIEIFVI
ncbi:hypothetical protein C3L23_02125 [Nautilia sp. PV-1]|nr:hypothetical protein C3L23_02125 [Nautilia sp. PV-1]